MPSAAATPRACSLPRRATWFPRTARRVLHPRWPWFGVTSDDEPRAAPDAAHRTAAASRVLWLAMTPRPAAFVTALALWAALAMTFPGTPTVSAAAPTAPELAQALQRRYDTIRDFSADFEHLYRGGVLRKQLTERG